MSNNRLPRTSLSVACINPLPRDKLQRLQLFRDSDKIMALPTETMLGPYEILAPIGAGGMGEVYRARDTRLDRDVAIKVLPEALARDQERILRFEREAKVLASLNHPNIAAIYGFEQFEGKRFLVMELAEGETLAERLDRGPIPMRDALEFADGIAVALEAAHDKGIMHRDLKPANVMVSVEGTVKVLDFGLAKAMMGDATGTDIANSPTITVEHTRPGVILGTAAYMSPEQARGRPLDKRTDVWSFGAVLYECLSGQRPFEGPTTSDLMAKILEREPDWNALPAETPPLVLLLLRRCLAKDRNKRLRDIGDARLEIENAIEDPTTSGVLAVANGSTVGRARLPWLLAIVLAGIAGAAWFVALRSGEELKIPPAFRTLNFRHEVIFRAFFAPDGRTVLYSAAEEGTTPDIFTVRPEYPEPQSMGLRGMHLLAVSSKGELAVLTHAKYVAHRFFLGTLARVPMGGGAPREILENVREAAWSPDGAQLAIVRKVGGKDRLEYPMGKVLCESAGYLSDPQVSPTGELIAYFEHPWEWDDRGSVNIVDMNGNVKVLADGYWGEEGIAWSPDGREIFYSAGFGSADWTVFAVTPDGQKRVAQRSPGGLVINDVAPDGRWLVTRDDMTVRLFVHDPATGEDRDLSWLGMNWDGFLSPDGQYVAFAEGALETNYTTCVRKIDGSPVVRLGEGNPSGFSPDGNSILAMVPSTPPKLVIYPMGPGELHELERGKIQNYSIGKWFPDGKSILICGNEPGKGTRLYVQDIAGGPPRAITPEGYQDGFVSPDAAFVLSRGSDLKYVILPIAGGEPKSTPLGKTDFVVHWCSDGRSVLAYREGELPCRVEHVDLETGRRELFLEIAPADRTGLVNLYPSFVTDAQQAYAYIVSQTLSTLFVSEGSP